MARNLVLCVDDEPLVLRACADAIAQAGFRTVAAENGVAALEAFIRLREEILVVLTDVVMPGMSGTDLARRILEVDPQAKILLMSGYGSESLEPHQLSRFPLLRKPFIYSVLIEKIRSLIGSEASDAAATGK